MGRILENEQYTGTMVYNRFKSENVGDKQAKALPEEEWKRVENCHVAIISKEDFEKAAVSKMAQVDQPEVAGFEMLEGQMKLQKLNKEIVDAFVVEIVVYDRERVEIKWKFRDELLEAEKGESCSN